ncbi:MAG TPA: hypothetical protein PKN33_15735 [Phycisphaerae bacterium]|nr:hypothetical protein [Phycisphaerae bacterium]
MLTITDYIRNHLSLKPIRAIGALTCAIMFVASAPVFAGTVTNASFINQSATIAATSQAGGDRSVEKLLDLSPEKAQAVYDLLAPQDVKVLVGRRNQGLHVRGTAKEVSTLEALAELMMRDADRKITDPAKYIEELQGTWDTTALYKLPTTAGEALLKVLAFPDVPVLVANESGGIGVRASKRDQAVIADVTRIQQGIEPTTMHAVPERKVAQKEEKRPRNEGRGRGDRRRNDRGDNNRRAERRPGPDGGGRELNEKVNRLEERVKKLEELAASLHSPEGHGHGDMHQPNKAHGDHGPDPHAKKGDGTKGDKKPGNKARNNQQAQKNKGKKKGDNKKDGDKQDPNEVVTMRYDLPAQHADNLYNLFAPSDIKDILVGRNGNTIEVRAARKHQRVIKQLVKMLAPDAKSEVTKKDNKHDNAQTG